MRPRAPSLPGEPTKPSPGRPGALAPARCRHGLHPPAAKTPRAEGSSRTRDGGTAPRTGTGAARSGAMPGQGKAGTSPAPPAPSAPSLCSSAKKRAMPSEAPPAPGQGPTRSGRTLAPQGARGQGGAPLRALAAPPVRNIEKTGAYKRATRGRVRAEPRAPAQESGSVPPRAPTAPGRGPGGSPESGPRRSGVPPGPSSSPSGSSDPGPASPCPFLAAGGAAPGSRRRSRRSLGPLPVASPGRAAGGGDGERPPAQSSARRGSAKGRRGAGGGKRDRRLFLSAIESFKYLR